MDRRTMLTGAGTAVAAALAGCAGLADVAGSPDVRWEYRWQSYVSAQYQPTLVVIGTVENAGGGTPTFDLRLGVLGQGGTEITSRLIRVEELSADEQQQFHAVMTLSRAELQSISDVQVTAPSLSSA